MEASTAYRIAAGGLVLLLVAVGLSVGMSGSAVAQSGESVDVDAADLAGSGTAADPYVINSVSGLRAMEDDLSAHYKLGSDINASRTADINNKKGFDPVASGIFTERFSGSLEGDSHTIAYLTVNRSFRDETQSEIGLIGKTATDAVVANISLKHITVSGHSEVGALIGNNKGKIKNVNVTGSVDGHDDTGGLVGVNNGTIANVTSLVNVSGLEYRTSGVNRTSARIGGLVGRNIGDVQDATVSAQVTGQRNVGGVIGEGGGMLQDVSTTGNVTGTRGVGGIIGENKKDGLVKNSTASTNATGWTVGSIAGSNRGRIQNTSASGLVNIIERENNQFAAGGIVGRNSGTIQTASFSGSVFAKGQEQSSIPVFIGGAGGIVGFNLGSVQDVTSSVTIDSTIPNTGGIVGKNGDFTSEGFVRNVTATVSINSSSNNIGGIIGFNENGTIQNSTSSGDVKGKDNIGGVIGESKNSEIHNVAFSVNVTGSDYVGGLIGINRPDDGVSGNIQNISVSTNVTGSDFVGGLIGSNDGKIQNVSISGRIDGEENVGGLVGRNNGIIQKVSVSSSVNGTKSVGGVAGVNNGRINNTKASGNVNASEDVGGLVGDNPRGSITNSFAVGQVTGSVSVGGLVGVDGDGVTLSYWDTKATGQSISAGNATGLTTTQMTGTTARSSMSALDFDTIWNIQSDGYPILAQQADDKSDQSGSAQVQLSSVTLTPQSVDSDSESTHQLTFEARNVSADGSEDDFDITFPDKVELVSYSDVEIDKKSSGVDMTANTLEFSVDPTGGGTTQISGELNVTVSATN